MRSMKKRFEEYSWILLIAFGSIFIGLYFGRGTILAGGFGCFLAFVYKMLRGENGGGPSHD